MHVSNSSGVLSASGVITTLRCVIHNVTLTQASANCSASVYDNQTGATGTVVAMLSNSVNNTTVNGPQLPYPVVCNAGAYLSLSGVGATAIVYYELL